jgi:RNA polymerase sigma factor (sigma-70 family)
VSYQVVDEEETGTMNDELEETVRRAQGGDAAALEQVVRAVQDDVFGLALRMLGHPDDARDAAQEVLIRVMTKLSTFQGESRFRTWVYRVAANGILNFRTELRTPERSFGEASAQLDAALDAYEADPTSEPDRDVLLGEVKVACTHGMLLCLDRPHRLAYVLGEILELPGEDAAAILEISPPAFRKRLSRARDEMEGFLRKHCGLAAPVNRCRCAKLLPTALATGVVDPRRLVLSSLELTRADRLRVDIEEMRTAAEIFRSLPTYAAPVDLGAKLHGWLRGNDDSDPTPAS